MARPFTGRAPRVASVDRRQDVAQRPAESLGLDLEPVARLRHHAIGHAQRGRAEKVHVYVTRTPEGRVFEVVALEVGQRVRHVPLAREKRPLPHHLAVAHDAARASHVGRRWPEPKLGPARTGPQLRVGEVQVILALHGVVRELVAHGGSHPPRDAVGADDVDDGQFRLLATIQREIGRQEGRARWREGPTVALVEPLGLHSRTLQGLPTFDTPPKHARRVGFGAGAAGSVEGVTCLGAAQVRQPRAGNQQVRRVRMHDRPRQPAVVLERLEGYRGRSRARVHEVRERHAACDGLPRERVGRGRVGQRVRVGAGFIDDADGQHRVRAIHPVLRQSDGAHG